MVENCFDNVFSLGMCKACYQRTRYWNNRPMKDKVKRLKQLIRCESSLTMQMGNVKPLRKVKRG